jgi:dTDP-4-amino-4,6-dideoxygalactose transaminase
MSAFASVDVEVPPGGFPVSDALVATVLGLPFHRDITAAEIDRIASVIESVQGARS